MKRSNNARIAASVGLLALLAGEALCVLPSIDPRIALVIGGFGFAAALYGSALAYLSTFGGDPWGE